MAGLGGSELLIVFAIILLIFGGSQLPKLARSLGQAQREFKAGTTSSGEPPAEVPPVEVPPAA